MGVPMVQKQVNRRTSLILGALLALLLGVAMGFIILALPITVLESVTTSIRLSRIMIQAEPPISPNDRTVLAVLAGILASGLGWVLVDWLLFGRVGMTTLIRPREDEYEDYDDDAFRPTDPLDLIMPMDIVPSASQGSSYDARRPLSARTDIGDPPIQAAPPFASPAMPQVSPGASASLDHLLPPIDQILPGITPQSPPAAPVGPFGAAPMHAEGATFAPPPVFTPPAPQISPLPTGLPDWLPSPGVRPEPASEERDEKTVPEQDAGPAADLPQPGSPADLSAPLAQPVFESPLIQPPHPFAPPAMPEPLIRPQPQPPFVPSAPADQPVHISSPKVPPLPEACAPSQSPVAPPAAVEPLASVPGVQPAAAPPPAPALPHQLSTQAISGTAPLDRAMIDDLLTRLEQGMRRRKAAAGALPVAAPTQAARPLAPVGPSAAPTPAAPVSAAPGAASAPSPISPGQAPFAPEAPPSWPPLVEPIVKRPPPAGFAMNDFPPPPITPLPVPPVVSPPASHAPGAGSGDQMIDQPLHVTLDQLRSMVRR